LSAGALAASCGPAVSLGERRVAWRRRVMLLSRFCAASFLICVSPVSLKRTKHPPGSEIDMAGRPVALRALLRQRHWKYATSCAEWNKAAKGIDPKLTGTWPSRAQFHRWINGDILTLQDRVRDKLTPGARSRLEIATYDETIRFNIVLVDDTLGIIQPYMPGRRGVDSPTFVLHRRWPDLGLFPAFEAVFSSLWSASKPL
jgi:Domain of unknown function (DUF5919)